MKRARNGLFCGLHQTDVQERKQHLSGEGAFLRMARECGLSTEEKVWVLDMHGYDSSLASAVISQANWKITTVLFDDPQAGQSLSAQVQSELFCKMMHGGEAPVRIAGFPDLKSVSNQMAQLRTDDARFVHHNLNLKVCAQIGGCLVIKEALLEQWRDHPLLAEQLQKHNAEFNVADLHASCGEERIDTGSGVMTLDCDCDRKIEVSVIGCDRWSRRFLHTPKRTLSPGLLSMEVSVISCDHWSLAITTSVAWCTEAAASSVQGGDEGSDLKRARTVAKLTTLPLPDNLDIDELKSSQKTCAFMCSCWIRDWLTCLHLALVHNVIHLNFPSEDEICRWHNAIAELGLHEICM